VKGSATPDYIVDISIKLASSD